MNTSKISRRSFLKGVGAAGATGLLAACGGGDSTAASGSASGGSAAAEGKVINIYSWNDEFRTRLEAVYPEVESTSADGTVTTLKDGTEIHWVINPNQDGVYQQKLDEALLNQASGAADDKVDIFLSETDYVYKYTDAAADVAMPLTDLGIDPDTDLADQYSFTKTTASDANGVQRGSTWQCCPGLLVYRRDIALNTFGTDDPVAIGEKVKDWDTFKASAEELKAKGYYALASYADTFRLYGNSISQPWGVEGSGTITVDPQRHPAGQRPGGQHGQAGAAGRHRGGGHRRLFLRRQDVQPAADAGLRLYPVAGLFHRPEHRRRAGRPGPGGRASGAGDHAGLRPAGDGRLHPAGPADAAALHRRRGGHRLRRAAAGPAGGGLPLHRHEAL